MSSAKILVVDDELELARLIQQRFRKQIKADELKFVFAADGVEALDRLQADAQVDIVLTDISMPNMDGLTLLEHLAQMDRSLRAVVMSAYSDLPKIRRAMNYGAFDFLTKPIDFHDLETTLQKALTFVQQTRNQQQKIQETQRSLLRAAYSDSLTGLPNRSWLMQRLRRLLERPQRPEFYAVLFVDLDYFKQVNDTLGHLIGDALLLRVSQRLQSCLREGDGIARLGGDEFAIILEGIADISEAVAVAQRIQDQLHQPFMLEGHSVQTGASIGITWNDQNYRSPEELLQNADVAMYCAKAQGKGCFRIFDPQMLAANDKKTHLIPANLPTE
ncbi:MAG: diguanylate cyclase [Elainella sp. Prado103]|jgi:diguanylate cyclase (GGDEF)-like protein|nr:diguanylate cyclase [Elainella sp. Prado103]